jgi:pSer/pThr/pTyr-binding forkhead associated (FHA) protein
MPIIILKLGESIVQKYSFDKDVFSVGRGRDNDIVIETLSISRNHARIRREGDRYILSDLNSANGTFVNGVKVTKAEIMHKDVIAVGKHQLHFQMEEVSGEQSINDAFGADRTILLNAEPVGLLIVKKGKQLNQEFALDRYESVVGRADQCQVRLHDWFVGKRHAIITREGGAFIIRDLGKLAGVHVNDEVAREPRQLRDGDLIKVGPVLMQFHIRADKPAGAPAGRKPLELGYKEEEPRDYDAEYDKEFDSIVEAMNAREKAKQDIPAMEMAPDADKPAEDDEPLEALFLEDGGEADEEPSAGEEGDVDLAPDPDGLELDIELESPAEAPAGELDNSQEAAFEAEAPVAVAEILAAEAALAEEDAPGAIPSRNLADDTPEFTPPPEETIEDELDSLDLDESDGTEREEPVLDEERDILNDASLGNEEPAEKTPEIAMWEKALENQSKAIRREAARMLKKLTGRDYDV